MRIHTGPSETASGWAENTLNVCEMKHILRYYGQALIAWLPWTKSMTRDQIILAAMSTVGQKSFRPVHIQKLFFLIDDRLCKKTGGPHFAFKPYDYGPFDQDVYHELDNLVQDGLVEISDPGQDGPRSYWLTDAGQELGDAALSTLEPLTQNAIDRLANFVRPLSFGDIVSAIYLEYPEMKVNSVFKG